jgi:ribosomal protein S18 acetylase RimI-like enzyme
MTNEESALEKGDGGRVGRSSRPAADGLRLERIRNPDHELLTTLETYDLEAFGATGLRIYDLAVMAEAGAVFVARWGEEIVGGCQVMRMLDEPDFFYVVGFYIRPQWQGRRLGRRLLELLGEESRRLGAAGLVLTVAPDNQRALNLYRSHGFVEERFVPHFYGKREDRHILRWRFLKEHLPSSV